MAADDVATAVARAAVGAPVNGVVEVAGPEQFHFDMLIRRFLDASEDPARVVADPAARYFGAVVGDGTLVPGTAPDPRRDPIRRLAPPVSRHPPRRPWHSASTAHPVPGATAPTTRRKEGQTMHTVSVQAGALDDRRARARSSRVAIALAVSALLLLSMIPATAAAKPALAADRPTIVLVHGSWAGPSGWDQVVAGLHKDGFATVTPTLGLATLAGDVATVRATLDAISGKKILVGHSYGGMVISGAASAGPTCSASSTPPGSCRSRMRRRSACWRHTPRPRRSATSSPTPSRSCSSTPAFFPQVFCQDLSPKKAAELNADHARPASPWARSRRDPPHGTLPSWYAISAQDRIIHPDLQAFMSARAESTVVPLRRREPRWRVHPLREPLREAHRGGGRRYGGLSGTVDARRVSGLGAARRRRCRATVETFNQERALADRPTNDNRRIQVNTTSATTERPP